jgi:hypothetical protein
MAVFIRGTGDPRTPLQHEREIFIFNPIIGIYDCRRIIATLGKQFFAMLVKSLHKVGTTRTQRQSNLYNTRTGAEYYVPRP